MESKLRSTRRIKFFGLWVMTLMLATAALFVTVTTVGGSSNSAKPLGGISFKVEIPGVITGPFESISGLQSETEAIEFEDGATPSAARGLVAPRIPTSHSNAATPLPANCMCGEKRSSTGMWIIIEEPARSS